MFLFDRLAFCLDDATASSHKISNKAITVGIDDSISWLSDNNRPSVNFINNRDEGTIFEISDGYIHIARTRLNTARDRSRCPR